jgi:hypothetical protein
MSPREADVASASYAEGRRDERALRQGAARMKTEYDYLRFVEKPRLPARATGVYGVLNKKSETELGMVRWHGPWRGYCFFPTIQAVYSAGCLKDIADFIAGLA